MTTATTTPDYSYEDGVGMLCNIEPDPAAEITQTIIHSVICAFGLFGNLLVITTYVFHKKAKTMTDVYLFNVAMADLIFVVALPLIIYNEQHKWFMGTAACKILRSAYSINLYSGMLLLACISGDRYVAIVHARRSFGSRSSALIYSRVICLVVWLSTAALTLPTLIYTKRFEENNGKASCEMSFDNNETAKLMKVLVPSLQMGVGFMLPLVVMLLCYSSVVFTLLRAKSSQRHKAVRVVLAVVVVFILCHLPYNVTLLVHTTVLFTQRDCGEEKLKFQVLTISRSVAYLHCCLNPILYAFVGVKFRAHFKQIIKDLCCFSKYFISSTRASRGTSEICISGVRISDGSNHVSSFSA
ncbi:C-C chemokine receptor type 6 [Synchiropus splendidus]|uniref:C-C chemokine receptor type 6 n=1 Tax=Synchiropus splendidus TaxID=270530 RepID=UPI00237E1C9E|nr:C-C chemokine receptor type 6 [Synchiropus splendidus]XP_053701449.1 C-C chemokine receptor type 6 [Synchiropus splendidus]